MKRTIVGMMWAFMLMWAGNYVALLTGFPAPMLAAFALGIGGAYVGAPHLRSMRADFVPGQSLPANPATPDILVRS